MKILQTIILFLFIKKFKMDFVRSFKGVLKPQIAKINICKKIMPPETFRRGGNVIF